MEIKDRQLIESTWHNFETVEHGYVRNLGNLVHEYHAIYKKYLDPNHVLTVWCSDCVFTMMKRLKHWFEQQPKVFTVQNPIEEVKALGVEVHPVKANRRRK